MQAALTQELDHAALFRSLLGIKNPSQDPVQTFYFPAGAFDSLSAFTGLLDALENAFIGAYLNAIQEFATKSAMIRSGDSRRHDSADRGYSAEELDYFAKVSASIMGVESEHRVLGRVISNSNPANNVAYEGTDGLNAVYNGPKSAVAASDSVPDVKHRAPDFPLQQHSPIRQLSRFLLQAALRRSDRGPHNSGEAA